MNGKKIALNSHSYFKQIFLVIEQPGKYREVCTFCRL